MTAMTVAAPAAKAFRLEREDDLGILWFDLPGEKVNKFSSAVIVELGEMLAQIGGMSDLKRLLIVSAKKGIFIAGADITEFAKVESAAQAAEFIRFGQKTFLELARLPQITVAVIDGACMGGGTELALNCDYRLATDHPKTSIGLPEVKLGIIPAWSGTTRLPRLVGLPAALDLILNGRSLDARRAKKAGLVDEVIPPASVLDAAKSYAAGLQKKRDRSKGRTHFYLEGNPLARKFVFSKARKAVIAKTGGHYPAPLKAIDVMARGLSGGLEAGLEAEARETSQLVMGPVAKNLVQLFFLMEEAKKDRGVAPLPIEAAGVLGAGVMGGGIAQLIVDKTDIPVRMKDISWEALAGGMKAAARLWKKKVDRRRMKRGEMERKLARITTAVEWKGFERADLVIEAVVENLEVKQSVLAEFEALSRPAAIFASNTSTIPITTIAAKAKRPENVVGMHFFNPVDRMPLVEVIAGEKSSAVAIATTAALARKMGKTVVLCKDGPGFIVNRILGPYMNEAAWLLQEGNSIEKIDAAMTTFGMPMGPMALLDEVGIDVAAKAGRILAESFGERMTAAKALGALLEDGRLGKKNGRGVYRWKNGKRTGPDRDVYRLVGIKPGDPTSRDAMVERMVLAMVNEASLVLRDGIVATAGELDLAMIMGTGFPPFRGGLLRYADALGIPYVAARLDTLQAAHGERFAPSDQIREIASTGSGFYERFGGKQLT
jgi:3-hydroxyacyl-CoA dehydrogenase / enoyl-CoA hydratase / 3-hydroxybutyryl-CoA epimerase